MVTSIIKYLKIYWKLVRFSASLEMEYRFSFLLEIFVEVAYFIVTLLGMRVIFWNVSEVAGWNYNQLLVLMGINMVFSETVLGFAFIFNLRDLPNKIAQGGLDIVLTKPLNSQFAVSLWRPYFAMFPSILAGILTSYIGFRDSGITFNPQMILPFLFIFFCGIIMAYAIGMIVSTLSMWFINATPLPMLAQQFLFMAKNPSSVFTGAWKVFFMTALPIAFMVSFPASTLLGKLTNWWLPASLVLALIFLKLSNVFWLFALKRYSSASS